MKELILGADDLRMSTRSDQTVRRAGLSV